MIINEKDLIIPALLVIEEFEPISTTNLIHLLTAYFNPNGEDKLINPSRNDTKFSQKVRNLKSHNTLSPYAIYENGMWSLSSQGKSYLQQNEEILLGIKKAIINNSL